MCTARYLRIAGMSTSYWWFGIECRLVACLFNTHSSPHRASHGHSPAWHCQTETAPMSRRNTMPLLASISLERLRTDPVILRLPRMGFPVVCLHPTESFSALMRAQSAQGC
jgi:hypothetical protein